MHVLLWHNARGARLRKVTKLRLERANLIGRHSVVPGITSGVCRVVRYPRNLKMPKIPLQLNRALLYFPFTPTIDGTSHDLSEAGLHSHVALSWRRCFCVRSYLVAAVRPELPLHEIVLPPGDRLPLTLPNTSDSDGMHTSI